MIKKIDSPQFLRQIFNLAEAGYFSKDFAPKKPFNEKKEKFLVDVLSLEKSCYIIAGAAIEQARDLIKNGARVDSDEVQKILRTANATNNFQWSCLEERLGFSVLTKKIDIRAGWKVVEVVGFDGMSYCHDYHPRHRGISTDSMTGLLLLR